LYEPLIEAQSQQTDPESQAKLCDAIHELLTRPNWRASIVKARDQLPKAAEGMPLLPLAEILTQAQSSRVVDAISQINQLAKTGHLRSAMELAYDSLQYAPNYLPLHGLIGEMLIQEGRLQDAISKFSVVAQAYSARGEAAQSTNLLRRIIQLAPMDLVARIHLAEQLATRGQADEAIVEYMELADTYYRLAELEMSRKTYANALRLAQQSSTHRNWSVQILHRMADIDTQRLDWRQALRVYEQIRTLQADDTDIRKRIIDLNLRLNQPSQASAELENFTAYLDSAGHRDEAIDFLEEMVNENPNQPPLRRFLAEEYRQAGRSADAITQLDALGDLLLEAGDKAGAIQAVESVIALNPPNIEDFKTVLANLRAEK
jgi:tetratricopeptide (TPR) repeat protein